MRKTDKKINLLKVNKLNENRYLENKMTDNGLISKLLHQNDGPVDAFNVISRGVEMACNGGRADDIANAIYEALEILKNSDGDEFGSVEMPRNGSY
jgi:hypothetical protein